MPTIAIVSDGDPILADWPAAVAAALNASHFDAGFLPFAYPEGFAPSDASSINTTLTAVASSKAGIALIPFRLPGPMRIQSVTIRSGDTASARSGEGRLYRDVGSADLAEVPGTACSWSFTPSAPSDRTANVATPGTLLTPGGYWLAIRNTSATQSLGIRRVANATEVASSVAAYDNTPNAPALGATLATGGLSLSTVMGQFMARLDGRVFGRSAAF